MTEPDWLTLSREVQAIAQNGLTFSTNLYDVARYHRLRDIASDLLAIRSGEDASTLRLLHAQESGYATPKIDVRAAVFDKEGRILLVRETLDAGRWTLPGGWADVNLTTAENAVKEAREESGYDVAPIKLAALWDRARQGHRPEVFSCAKLFYICRLVGGVALQNTDETCGTGWFTRDEIPADLSSGRVRMHQIERMFDHHQQPDLMTDFE
ncbi:NUDIX hydrolase [Candidatus Kirkpatrickella diaphorinae]|uniref:NUDIX hydrolase n=1 Tax=Candidatus Kirkpatrickella diaphorinae TaxID=2984322 RepID=A0ABY6GGV8_9PROT|nr:NUDIX hydrolase [Candidatus Kirkpatrickella diaphorinae]UYH50750.1 NUDIX hydrolase [Candidatus Kirkpatrickella diaphorinae]